MKKVIIIPARLNSSRLKNKVILDLKGKTIIQRVFERCIQAKNIDEVFIATDSQKIKKLCEPFTKKIIMTKNTHKSGTDRIAEAVENINCDVVINIQGDEPFIDIDLIEELSTALDQNISMVSAMHKIKLVDELINPNVVKVNVYKDFNAMYFSRSIIPYHTDKWDALINHHTTIPEPLKFYRHLGVYGYTKEFLKTYSNLEQTYLEKVEKLEQLRVLENGYKIKMIKTNYNSFGIDTQEDYEKAKELLGDKND